MCFIDLKPSELTNGTVLFDKLVNNLTSCQTPNHISQSTTTLINDTTKCRMQNKALEPLQWFTFMYIHTLWYKSIHNFHLLRLLSMFHFCYSGACSYFHETLHTFSRPFSHLVFIFYIGYQSALFYHSHIHKQECYLMYVKGYFVMQLNFILFSLSNYFKIILRLLTFHISIIGSYCHINCMCVLLTF